MGIKMGDEESTKIDMSKMSAEKRKTLELTEAARQQKWDNPSFIGNVFMGKLPFSWIHPFPELDSTEIQKGESFLAKLHQLLKEEVNPEEIEKLKDIPDKVQKSLAQIGAMGIKVKPEYGGLGLSQYDYVKAAILTGSHCSNTAAYLSVHQSVGVSQPLILFGTEEQKKKFLPRVASGEVAAFALTEKQVGSDPGRMETTAVLSEDKRHYILNGEKLWCTNGVRAKLLVVAAQTKMVLPNGKTKEGITTFIVEKDSPGLTVTHQCDFMGLKAIANGVIQFKDVKVPVENTIGEVGKGLKVALTTLNTGRLTIAGMSVGLSKQSLKIARVWAKERHQWGVAIGQHDAIAQRLAKMAASTFAMEAMLLLTSGLVDKGGLDIRLESALCKMWATEQTWENINHAIQIRGGRGYETSQSLRERGEVDYPLERFLRDNRISTIFEGSSEIIRLLISREALDPHLRIAGDAINSTKDLFTRLKSFISAGSFYSWWYPSRYLPSFPDCQQIDPRLKKHIQFASCSAKKLSRTLFHQMIWYGSQLDQQQGILGRLVDISAEIFALTASCSYADYLAKKGDSSAIELAIWTAHYSKIKIGRLFWELAHHKDQEGYQVAQELMNKEYLFLEKNII